MFDTNQATVPTTVADPGLDLPAAAADFDLDVLTVPIGETPTSRRIVDSGTYTCSTSSCCTTNACH